MGYKIQRLEGRMKKNIGRLTGNYKLQVHGAIQENRANLKEKWFKDSDIT
jgi:uncharacterized protein YjbJ (UPF0337 family)